MTQMSKSVSLCCFTAPSFPDKMSPIKALTMKDYENVSDLYKVAWYYLNWSYDVSWITITYKWTYDNESYFILCINAINCR